MAQINKVAPDTRPQSSDEVRKQVYVEKQDGNADAVTYFLIVMQGITILLWGLFVEFADSADPLTSMSMAD